MYFVFNLVCFFGWLEVFIDSFLDEVAEFKDNIEIAIVYNCTEPLPKVKEKRLKKDSNYKPEADVTPYPIFVLRKCHESTDPCRIFIDHTGRVYETWLEYLSENKLPDCQMTVPKGGR